MMRYTASAKHADWRRMNKDRRGHKEAKKFNLPYLGFTVLGSALTGMAYNSVKNSGTPKSQQYKLYPIQIFPGHKYHLFSTENY